MPRTVFVRTKAIPHPPLAEHLEPSLLQRWSKWARLNYACQLIAAFLFSFGAASVAAPFVVVVYDSGQTVPISQFLAPAYEESEGRPGASAGPVVPDPARAPMPVGFPVRTPSMSPGKLQANPTKLQSWLPVPVFLVGTDDFSKAWIVRNRERLAKQNAAGIVVHADNLEAFRALQSLGRGLPMAPSGADEIAKRLRLSVYPVVIQADGTIVQ